MVFGLNTDEINGDHTSCDVCGKVLHCKGDSALCCFVEGHMHIMHRPYLIA